VTGLEPATFRSTVAGPPAPTTLEDNTCGNDTLRPDRASTKAAPEPSPADPDLARVVTAWPDLPPHIRAAVLALVQAGR
jgi:hypothetical protein